MNILGFLGASIILTLMPGPDILFVISQSLSQGKKAGIVFALGLCTGLIVHTSAAAFGLSLIIYSSPMIFKSVQYAGAAYLLYLSYKIFQSRKQEIVFGNLKSLNFVALYKRGIIMNILNPKVSMFFVAFLPQFCSIDGSNQALQMLVLGAVFMVQAIVIFSTVAVLAGTLRTSVLRKPQLNMIFSWIQIAVFVLVAANLLISSFL